MMTKLLRNNQITIWIFFIAILFLGLAIYRDYGFAIDEINNRNLGIISLNYIGNLFNLQFITHDAQLSLHQHLPKLSEYIEVNHGTAEHGPIFEILSVALERIFNIGGSEGNLREIYQFHHLLVFLTALWGAYSLYQLAKRRFSNPYFGFLAVIFFFTSPRFFADSFYNSKDLVLAAIFAVALNAIIIFIQKPIISNAIKCGILCGIAIDIRISGLFLIMATLPILILYSLNNGLPIKKLCSLIFLFLISCCAIVYIFWPWLWPDPFTNIQNAFKVLSKIPEGSQVLFMGNLINGDQLPWYYLLVWIFITTPLVYSALWLIGLIISVYQLITINLRLKKPLDAQDFVFFGVCIGPILSVIILHPILYDGWRHFYFIYPAFIIIALIGLNYLWKKFFLHSISRLTIFLVMIAAFSSSLISIVQLHPFQNTYFNFLAGKNWKEKFDVDYWWLSADKGFNLIYDNANKIANRPNECANSIYPPNTCYPIKVFLPGVNYADMLFSANLLSKNKLNAFQIVGSEVVADYILTNYRLIEPNYTPNLNFFIKLEDIKAGDEIISTIYKRNTNKVINKNDVINFNSQSGNNFYLTRGWSNPENWGTWSLGEIAHLLTPLPRESVNMVTLNLLPFVSVTHPVQKIKIWMNGVYIQDFDLTNADQHISLNLNSQAISHGYLLLWLQFLNPMKPNKDEKNMDDRDLSIGLKSIYFH